MLNLAGNPASINKTIPLEKLFSADVISDFEIESASWIMTIKPKIRSVTPYIQGRTRLEEIEAISVRANSLPDTPGYRYLLSQIHAKIRYPCVVFFEYKDKYKISAWKFIDGEKKNENVLKSSFVSAWIRTPPASNKTARCSNSVHEILLNGEGDIKDLYDQICHYILNCTPQYVGSRAHLKRILYALTGSRGETFIHHVDCSKRFVIENLDEKYKKRRYTSQYTYCYEYEDIWYAFMNDEKLKRIIEKRRYRDAEDMIFQIDTQYEERRGW